MSRLITAVILFALLITGIAAVSVVHSERRPDTSGEYAVKLNEIQKLIEQGEDEKAALSAKELRKEIRTEQTKAPDHTVAVMCGICLIFLGGVSLYCWIVMIRPFHRLTDYAELVARGELDKPFEYERTNWFGKFTWAFDSMRHEILRARACEKEAIENNKTVIASLSHDIKTPVSSIRAYAEALELGMDSDTEKRRRYIGVMIRKCDEVSKLTEDMLTHSLSDLDKLKMSPESFELNSFLEITLDDISAGREDITFERPAGSLYVYADKSRIAQIVENITNNARKYAGTDILITITRDAHTASIHFRDYGNGIPDEEMPFVFGKFYRGKGSKGEKGAGLGLFIVKYIAEQSGGDVMLKNCDKGLEVTVRLPITEQED